MSPSVCYCVSKALINSNNIFNNALTNKLITPDQQNTIGLTGEMEMFVYILTHRHRVVSP